MFHTIRNLVDLSSLVGNYCKTDEQRSHSLVDFRIVSGNTSSPQSDGSIAKRAPLSGISVNIPSPLSFRGFNQTCAEDGTIPSGGSVTTKIGSTSKSPNMGMGSTERCDLDGSFMTPATERNDGCTSLHDRLPNPNVLDDDFDDSLLEEIDAFCDHKLSHSKADIGFPTPDPDNIDSNSESVHVTNNIKSHRFIQNENLFQFIPEGVGSPSVTKAMDLPQQYSKYLVSLNERQREAAFSDITIPLMIVAGPGSGKARIPAIGSIFSPVMFFLLFVITSCFF